MSDTTAEAQVDALDTEHVEPADESDVTEVLVEEVSIDGMCGVY
jgi:mycofactocin precursor